MKKASASHKQQIEYHSPSIPEQGISALHTHPTCNLSITNAPGTVFNDPIQFASHRNFLSCLLIETKGQENQGINFKSNSRHTVWQNSTGNYTYAVISCFDNLPFNSRPDLFKATLKTSESTRLTMLQSIHPYNTIKHEFAYENVMNK